MSREEHCECCGKERDCGLRFREGWTRGSIYRPGDAVPLVGSSYVAIHPNQNDEPPSPNWALIAGKGDAGPAGPAGPAGRAGPPGASGVSDAYTLVSGYVDLTNGQDIGAITVPPGNYVITAVVQLDNIDGDSQSYGVTLANGGTVLAEEQGILQQRLEAGYTTNLSLLAFITTNVTTKLTLRGQGYNVLCGNQSGRMVALSVGAFHSG